MTHQKAIAIHRAVERGADLTTLLLACEEQERRRAVAWLYSEVPRPVRGYYSRMERERAKERARLSRIEKEALRELVRIERERLEAIIADWTTTDEQKRLARIELVHAPEYEEEW